MSDPTNNRFYREKQEQPSSKQQVAFEAWCKESGEFTDWSKSGAPPHEYQKPRVQLAWKVWQAAWKLGAAGLHDRLRRINAINDNPAVFNREIDALSTWSSEAVPDECNCDPAAYRAHPLPICSNFVKDRDDDYCANCEHDEACHPRRAADEPPAGPTQFEQAHSVVANVVRSLGGQARVGAALALNAIAEAMVGTVATQPPKPDQCQRAVSAPELLRGTGGGASPPSWPTQPPPAAIDEHDAGVIRDLEAMAANQLAGFWPQALAVGALRLIRRNAQPPPADTRVLIETLHGYVTSTKDQMGYAKALENIARALDTRTAQPPKPDQCQRAVSAPELLRGTGGGASPPSWPTQPPSADAEALLDAYDACWIEDERLCNREHGPTRQAAKAMRERFDKARAAVLAAMRPAQPPEASRDGWEGDLAIFVTDADPIEVEPGRSDDAT